MMNEVMHGASPAGPGGGNPGVGPAGGGGDQLSNPMANGAAAVMGQPGGVPPGQQQPGALGQNRTLTPINRLKKRMEGYRGLDDSRGQRYSNAYLPAHNAQQFNEMKMLQRKVESTKSKKGGSKKASQAAKQNNSNSSAMQQQQQQQQQGSVLEDHRLYDQHCQKKRFPILKLPL